MAENILVAYTSRTGTTQAISEELGDLMRSAGNSVTVMEASTVPDVSAFSTVVIGSPIYGGAVLDHLISFCELHELQLMRKRVAVFTVGMQPYLDPAGALVEHEGAVQRLRMRVPGVKPVSHQVLPGAYDPEKVNFISRMLMSEKGAPTGDFRDSRALQRWAGELVQQMAA